MIHARLLTYLDAVATTGSMRAAAARLGVAPSSISRQIAELETGLKAPVFRRAEGRLALTPVGEVLMAHVRQTLAGRETLLRRIAELTTPDTATLTIATMNGLVGGLVARVVLGFSQRFPRLRCHITSGDRAAILRAVLAGDVDLGIGYNMGDVSGIVVLAQRRVRVVAVVAPHHPLARAKSIHLSRCRDYPAILADETMSLHDVVVTALARHRVPLNIVLKSDSIGLIKSFLADGQSIAYLNEADIAEENREGTLVPLSLLDSSMPAQTLSVIRREAAELPVPVALFAEEFAARLRAF